MLKTVKQNYFVVEKKTCLIVGKFDDRQEARTMCNNLNLGNGFEGFSPSFMGLGVFDQPNKKGDYSLE